jgi:hypothetical protein
VRVTIEEHPECLTDAKFVDEVIDMFQRYLGKDPG